MTLLVLATGHRIHTSSLIEYSDICMLNTNLRTQNTAALFRITYYGDDSRLCVATLTQKYLDMTVRLRQADGKSLLITYKKTAWPALKQTLSRGLKIPLTRLELMLTCFQLTQLDMHLLL